MYRKTIFGIETLCLYVVIIPSVSTFFSALFPPLEHTYRGVPSLVKLENKPQEYTQ